MAKRKMSRLSVLTGNLSETSPWNLYLKMREELPEQEKREFQTLVEAYPLAKPFPSELLRHHPSDDDDFGD
jgi:hypothetical protein